MEEFSYILMERLLASERITRGKERVARIKKKKKRRLGYITQEIQKVLDRVQTPKWIKNRFWPSLCPPHLSSNTTPPTLPPKFF